MTPIEVLKSARELLSDPVRWTKGCLARDANGVSVHASNGVCWCLMGAVIKVCPDDDDYMTRSSARHFIHESLEGQSIYGDIPSFNDAPDTTHEDLLKTLDKAIEFAVANNKAGG